MRCIARECNRRTILWEIVAWATVARVARRWREQTGYVRCDGGIHLLSHDFCIYPQGCTRSVRSGTLSACGYTVCARQCVYIYMCVCMCVLRCFETYILRSQWSKRRTKSRRRCATAVARDAAHAASSALSNRDIIRRSAGHTKELKSSYPIKHMYTSEKEREYGAYPQHLDSDMDDEVRQHNRQNRDWPIPRAHRNPNQEVISPTYAACILCICRCRMNAVFCAPWA